MSHQERDRQILEQILKHLTDLERKVAANGKIRLPGRSLQRLRQPTTLGQPWRKPRSLEQMAEEFALSQRCGALIYEIFTDRPRMAYTKMFSAPTSSSGGFNEPESTGIRELEYWLNDFLDTLDKLSMWY